MPLMAATFDVTEARQLPEITPALEIKGVEISLWPDIAAWCGGEIIDHSPSQLSASIQFQNSDDPAPRRAWPGDWIVRRYGTAGGFFVVTAEEFLDEWCPADPDERVHLMQIPGEES